MCFPSRHEGATHCTMVNEGHLGSSSWLGRLKARLLCLRGQHEPLRNRVRKDGLYYTGKCLACGKPIRKRNGRPWKPYKP